MEENVAGEPWFVVTDMVSDAPMVLAPMAGAVTASCVDVLLAGISVAGLPPMVTVAVLLVPSRFVPWM